MRDVLRPSDQLAKHVLLGCLVSHVLDKAGVRADVVLGPTATAWRPLLCYVLRFKDSLDRHIVPTSTSVSPSNAALNLILVTVSTVPAAVGAVAFFLDSLASHARRQALHVSAELAAITLALVDDAIAVLSACVGELLADGALEEPLAALTTVHTVMLPRGSVAADGAEVLGATQGRVVGRGRPRPGRAAAGRCSRGPLLRLYLLRLLLLAVESRQGGQRHAARWGVRHVQAVQYVVLRFQRTLRIELDQRCPIVGTGVAARRVHQVVLVHGTFMEHS